MKVVITGGTGFLGQRLARQLLGRGDLTDAGGATQTIDEITLVDMIPGPDLNDPRVRVVTGDLADEALLLDVIHPDTASIFHLAAVVSGEAEADFDRGMRINLDATRQLLDICRMLGHCPKVVFTSSVAVYGGRLPELVHDTTALTPQSSYGTQKAIGELLLNDYSRRGFVDGRALRLPTVSVRPGRPNRAASSFASGIIREPLNGEDCVCPVSPEMRLWLLSPRKAIESLLAMHELPASSLGHNRSVNAPGLSITVAEMVAALERVAGPDVVKRIGWQANPEIERIVGGWPSACDVTRAYDLGLRGDSDFDEVVRAYLDDDVPANPRHASES